MQRPALLPRTINGLAATGDVSPNTVRRRLRGLPLQPSVAARLDAAAAKLGVVLPPLAPPAPEAPAAPPVSTPRP